MAGVDPGGRDGCERDLLMNQFGVRSLELPSGGWWVLDTRVSHRLAREMSALLHGGDTTAIGHVLSCMTVAWGFDDIPSVEAVTQRDFRDIEAATMVLRDELIPALRILETTDEAERVFGALVADRIPDDYRDEALMADTGWSWQQLQDTPEDVVRRMRLYLSVRSVVERGWESQSQ